MKNYYEELEVSRNASNEVISKAYKALAKKYHPDTTTESKQLAEERFKKISEAYEVLSNRQKRIEYDKTLPPEITTDKYNKILEDNKKLSSELINLKSRLNNINATKTTYKNNPKFNPPHTNNSYNYTSPNQNGNHSQPNYNTNVKYQQPNHYQQTNYSPPKTNTYKKQYSFLDELKFKLLELGKKIFAFTLTFFIIIIALGILYIIPTTRNFLINDLQLGNLFIIFN